MDNLGKIIKNIYLVTFIGFIALGIIMVFTQLLAVITLNGQLAISAKETLRLPAIRLSIICAFSAFFYRYTNK